MKLEKLISGGQTGVDQGALDAAIELGIPHGGWCPRGRRSEAGPIPAKYNLQETGATSYNVRTIRNITDATATLIIMEDTKDWSPGTRLTLNMVLELKKPYMVFKLGLHDPGKIQFWLTHHEVKVLNVAGPRESKYPGIQEATTALLVEALQFSRYNTSEPGHSGALGSTFPGGDVGVRIPSKATGRVRPHRPTLEELDKKQK